MESGPIGFGEFGNNVTEFRNLLLPIVEVWKEKEKVCYSSQDIRF